MNSKDIVLVLKFKDNRFTLGEDFIVWAEIDGDSQTFKVEKGFRTDLASIPPWLHWWIRPEAPCVAVPALAHDWLYRNGICTRKQADEVLYQKCISFGAGFFKATLVYLAVRLFAGKYYQLKKSTM